MMVTNASTPLPKNSIDLPASTAEFLKLGVQVFIALFGIVGNILVIHIVGRQSRKKSVTDFCMQTLAAADLLVLSVNFPLAVIKERLPVNWPFGEFSCQYLYPIPEMFYGASVWTIVAISVERYRGIVLGARIRSKAALTRIRRISVCLWALSFVVFSLPLFFYVDYEENASKKICNIGWPLGFFQAYAIVLMLCSYVLPLACVCWTYAQVHRCLQRSNSFIKAMFDGRDVTLLAQQSLSRTEEKRLHQNKRANKILTPVVVLFSISMLPLTVFRTAVPFWLEIILQPFYHHLIYVISVGAMINSAANPLIYCFGCEEFRVGLKQLIWPSQTRSRTFSGSSTGTLQVTST